MKNHAKITSVGGRFCIWKEVWVDDAWRMNAEMVKLKSTLHSLERIFLACSLGVVGGYANIKPLMKQKLLISSYPTVGTSRSKIVWAR